MSAPKKRGSPKPSLGSILHVDPLVPRTFEVFQRGGISYGPQAFLRDIVAGIIVGIVALPLAMGFAISSGATPAQGIYTAIVAGFIVSFLGGSRYQIGGPTGAFVVIIFGVISRHGMTGLILATAMAGLMLILLGITGMGRFIKYIPYPVTTGFTSGIGVIIFCQQLKDFFGLKIPQNTPAFLDQWSNYITYAPTLGPYALGVGLGTLAVILGMRKLLPRIPGAAVAVIIATLAASFFKLPVETIGSKFGGIPHTLPVPVIPALNFALVQDVFRDAVTIAMLAAIESLLSAVVADSMTGDRHNANMELIAQGIANIASVIFGGIPATGAIARTATNIKNGAASPIAGMIHAVTLVLFVLFLAPVASSIPLASLSAVLLVVAYDMAKMPKFIEIIKTEPISDSVVLVVTFLITIFFDLTLAVEIGMILAVVLFLKSMIEVAEVKSKTAPVISILAEKPANYKNRRIKDALFSREIEVYEVNGPFFFGAADLLMTAYRKLLRRPKVLVLRMRGVPAIDSTGISALESFLKLVREQEVHLILSELNGHPRKTLEKAGFVRALSHDYIVPTMYDALDLADDLIEESKPVVIIDDTGVMLKPRSGKIV